MRIRALYYIFLILLAITDLGTGQAASAAGSRNCNPSTPTPEMICSQIPEIKIETVYPAHMIINQSYVITVSLVSKTEPSPILQSLEKATMVVTEPTPVGTPGATVQQAFGQGFEPFATATLNAGSFKVLSAPSGEQSLRQRIVEWDWNVTPQYTGTQILSVDIEVAWKPIKVGGGSVLPPPTYRIGNPQLIVDVTKPPTPPPPLFTLGQITLGDLITQMIIGILIFSTLAVLFLWTLKLLQEGMKKKI